MGNFGRQNHLLRFQSQLLLLALKNLIRAHYVLQSIKVVRNVVKHKRTTLFSPSELLQARSLFTCAELSFVELALGRRAALAAQSTNHDGADRRQKEKQRGHAESLLHGGKTEKRTSI